MMKRLALAVVLTVAWTFGAQVHAATPYRGGAVATAHPRASEAALQMLERGGTAADAAVAAAFVLAVVGPYHSGLGGGGFALVFDDKTAKTQVLDFREVAPGAATREMFLRDGKVVPGLSTDGALSVAVPGAVEGYLALHKEHGKLPLRVVVAPALKAAREGFVVTPKYRDIARARVGCLAKDEEAAGIFLVRDPEEDGGWAVPEIGHLVRQRDLAKTLAAIVRSGEDAFYRGRVARAIEKTVKEKGGVLTAADLAAYEVRWREPLEGRYRGHRILTMPPPSAGGLAVVQVLGALEVLLPQPPRWRDPLQLHLYAEAVRRSYVDRAKYLGDPDQVEIPLSKLASADYIRALAASIDPRHATPSEKLLDPGQAIRQRTLPEDGAPGGRNTTHISVVDRAGNAVAMTTTVNYGFGSCLVAAGTGVLLNDEMDDFAALPMVPNAYGLVTGEANAVAPGKIPLSSMSPTLVFAPGDPGKLMLVVGSPGGSTIPTTVIQVILNVVDHGMDVVRAVGTGRLHHQYIPDILWVDRYGLEPATREALRAYGHTLGERDQWGDAEAVYIDPETGLRYAGSDPRNEGAAVGQP